MMPDFNQWRSALAIKGIHSSQDLAIHLLEDYRIATLAGSNFGLAESDLSLRLSTSFIDLENDAEAEAVLKLWQTTGDAELIMREYHPKLHEAMEQLKVFVAGLNKQGTLS